MVKKVLVGADPELFLIKDGEFHSGFGIIPGTKDNPHPVPNGAIQVDGMALEFNVEPTNVGSIFRHNVNSVLQTLREFVPAEYHFTIVPAVEFSTAHIASQPEQALMLGCEPDFNAYTMRENTPPETTGNIRTAAGHVHIGWTKDADPSTHTHMVSCTALVQQLDCLLGLASVLYETDARRRTLYGRAGAFRPKPYGLEYRVPSNFWISESNKIDMVFRMVQRAVSDLRAGKIWQETFLKHGYNVQDVINKHERTSAAELLRHARLQLPRVR